MRLTRSILIALGLVALSATLVVAAKPATMPESAAPGLQRAMEKSGHPVPMAPADAGDPDVDVDDADDADEEPAEHPDNHGAAVSEAAHDETPEEFTNHGAYVSSVARDNAGQATAAERAEAGSENRGNGHRP